MSIYLMNEVDLVDLPRPQVAVLTALANFANDDGDLFPKIESIAWRTRYDERQVRRIVAELVAVGVLEVVEVRRHLRRATIYRLRLDLAPKRTPRSDRAKCPVEKTGSTGQNVRSRPGKMSGPDTSLIHQKENLSSDAVEAVMAQWRIDTVRRAGLNPTRTKKIQSALKLFTPAELRLAVVGALANPYFATDNPHYLNPETLFRDDGTIQRHMAHARKHCSPQPWWPPEGGQSGSAPAPVVFGAVPGVTQEQLDADQDRLDRMAHRGKYADGWS